MGLAAARPSGPLAGDASAQPSTPEAAGLRARRVALVIERFGRGSGGVENVAFETARGLVSAGDRVTVVTRSGVPPAGVDLVPVRAPGGWQPLRVLGFSRAAARATRHGFDVVQSFSRTRHQDVFRAGGGIHAEFLERCHAGDRLRRLSPRHATLLAIERRVFADPRQLVVCNSRWVRDGIAERYRVPPERLAVVPNGVDLERFHPRQRGTTGRALRERLGAGDRTVWLFAGSGFARKGLDVALRALARGGTAGDVLWVAGRDAPARWRRLAATLGVEERVVFLGARNDLEGVFAACDALLLPTRYDAFANVCLEACAAGVPVVTSASNGAAEIARQAGRVVERADDVEGFAEALHALRSPEVRRALGKAGRALAEGFPWSAHVAALRAVHARVAKR